MKIFAHRGASGYAPENTLAAYKKAVEQGADGIEIDIQLTRDNKIIVIHDWTVNRTTNGEGYVYDLELDYLRSLDAGSWYGKEYAGEKLPILEEVLELIPENMMLNIEIKDITRGPRGIENYMLDILKKYPEKKKNIIISSFHHNVIKRLQSLDPELRLALLTSSDFVEIEKYLEDNKFHCYSYHPEVDLITKEAIEALHEKNIQVYVWTVNTEVNYRYLKSIGVDGVITNYPDVMKKL